jgi:hypothetical protein
MRERQSNGALQWQRFSLPTRGHHQHGRNYGEHICGAQPPRQSKFHFATFISSSSSRHNGSRQHESGRGFAATHKL